MSMVRTSFADLDVYIEPDSLITAIVRLIVNLYPGLSESRFKDVTSQSIASVYSGSSPDVVQLKMEFKSLLIEFEGRVGQLVAAQSLLVLQTCEENPAALDGNASYQKGLVNGINGF